MKIRLLSFYWAAFSLLSKFIDVYAWEWYFFLFLKIILENSFLWISLEDVLVYFSLKKAAWSFFCDPKTSMNLEM